MDLAGEDRGPDREDRDEDRDLPVSIPSARSNCEPHECSRRSTSAEEGPGTARNAGEGSLLEENPLGAKCTQW